MQFQRTLFLTREYNSHHPFWELSLTNLPSMSVIHAAIIHKQMIKNVECMNQESGRSCFSSNQHRCRNASSTSSLTSHTSNRIPTCNTSMVWWTKPKSCQKSWWIEKEWTDLGSSICSSTLGNPKTVSSWKETQAASTTMSGANGLVVHQWCLPENSLLEVRD